MHTVTSTINNYVRNSNYICNNEHKILAKLPLSKNIIYRLFADDCIIHRTISSPEDSLRLQEDLDRIFNWTTCWQMQFNVQKCIVL